MTMKLRFLKNKNIFNICFDEKKVEIQDDFALRINNSFKVTL